MIKTLRFTLVALMMLVCGGASKGDKTKRIKVEGGRNRGKC